MGFKFEQLPYLVRETAVSAVGLRNRMQRYRGEFDGFLGCGTPVLANHFAGDIRAVLEESGVDIAVRDFDKHALVDVMRCLVDLSSHLDTAGYVLYRLTGVFFGPRCTGV